MKHLPVWLIGFCLFLCSGTLTAAEKLTPSEVKQLLDDRTISGATAIGGVGFTVQFASDGNVSVDTDSHGSDRGKWRVDNDAKFCIKYQRFFDGLENCFTLAIRNGQPESFRADNGAPTYWEFK